MKLILEPTERIVRLAAPIARVWKGRTEGGTEILALIAGVTARRADENADLQAELIELPFDSTQFDAAEAILGRVE